MSESEEESAENFGSYVDYEHVLIIPFFSAAKEAFYQYFARIQSFADPPFLYGILYCIFTIFQQVLSGLLFTVSVKNQDDVISKFLSFISVLWCGGGFLDTEAGIITSSIFLAIDVAFFFFLCWRVYSYKKTKFISELEEEVMISLSKYFIPVSLPFVAAGLPINFYGFLYYNGTVFQLVLALICIAVVIMYMPLIRYFFCPRVMFAREVLHEWEASVPMKLCIISVLSTVFTIAAKYTDRYINLVFVIIQMCVFLFTSIYTYRAKCYVNPKMILVFSSTMLALGLVYLVNAISIFVDIDSYIVILSFIVLFLFSYIVYSIIVEKSIINFVDQIGEFQEDDDAITAPQLAKAIKATIDLCLPGVFSLFSIERKLERSKDRDELLLVYCRLISSFPHYNGYLKKVIYMLRHSGIPERRILELQVNTISKRRSTSTTPDMVSFFNSVDVYKRFLDTNSYKFWENVIQNNTEAFWSNVTARDEYLNTMLKDLKHVAATYENSPEVLSLVVKLHSEVTYHYDEIPPLKESLSMVESGKPAHQDRAMANLVQVFPGVMNISEELVEDIKIVGTSVEVDNNVMETYETKKQLYDLIKSSSVGSSNLLTIYLVIVTVLVCVLSYLLYNAFKSGVTNQVQLTTDTLAEVNSLLFNLPRYALLLYHRQSIYAENSPLNDVEAAMQQIAKHWYKQNDDIPLFQISEEEVYEAALKVRGNLEKISTLLNELDTSAESVHNFISNYNQEVVEETGETIQVSIVDLLLRDKIDEKYVDEILAIYKQLKQYLSEFADSTSFDANIENTNWYMVLVIISDIVLLALPVMLRLFYITTLLNEIAAAFSTLPTDDIREALGKDRDSVKSKNKASVSLAKASSSDYSCILTSSMLITVLPVIVCSIAFYFFGLVYIDDSLQSCQSAAYLKTGDATVRMTFIAMTQAYQEAYVDTDPANINEDIVTKSMKIVAEKLTESSNDVTKGLLMSSKQIPKWLSIEDEYRTMYYPLNESDDYIPACGEGFERLMFQKWTHAIDNLIFIMGITFPGDSLSLMYYYFESYLLWWAYEKREVPYYNTILTQLYEDISQSDAMVAFFIIIVIALFAGLVFVIGVLNMFKNRVNSALLTLLQLNPDVVLRNPAIMSVISTGRYHDDGHMAFQNGDCLIKYSNYGIIVVDNNYKITDKNKIFEETLKNVNNLMDFKELPGDIPNSPKNLILDVTEAFKGNHAYFVRRMTTEIDGKPMYFDIEAIAVTSTGIAYDNDEESVTSCIMLFTNKSKSISLENVINKRKEELNKMLEKVLPTRIVNDLMKGAEMIAFNVHCVTIGEIRVKASKRFSFSTSDPHKFYFHVYSIFDRTIEKYPELCKVRTFAHTYTFAGGLFMSVNKPEKHAEESVRFLLDIISQIPQISAECGTEVSLVMSVHTGGPIVAGVMSIDMPSFMIIGSVHKYISELKNLEERNVIHASRAVYELVFSLGFKITEGETITIDKEKFPSYTISL